MKQTLTPKGTFHVTHVRSDGTPVQNGTIPTQVTHNNIIVNSGRENMARLLGGTSSVHIEDIVLGEGAKEKNLPNLGDTSLVQRLRRNDDVVEGVYSLDAEQDLFYPEPTQRFPEDSDIDWGSDNGTFSISGGITTFKDTTVDFRDIGVQKTDQFVVDLDPIVRLSVRQLKSVHEVVLHNPHRLNPSGSYRYRIETPGTQLLVSKLIQGNNFPVDEWGTTTEVTEAGLLMSDGSLFNRTIFGQGTDGALLLQPSTATQDEISLRFEVIITL